jgi:formylglycine-generating enzyme required for sulfatase activity
MELSRAAIEDRCRRIDEAETDDFATLVRLVGLDTTRNLRRADWSDVSFRNTDIRGFDFTAARLHNCDFTGARIAGACFAQAELGAVLCHGHANLRDPARMTGIANLRAAADWTEYIASFADTRWGKPAERYNPIHLPVGSIFSDAPGLAPEMVVVPPGTFLMGSPDGSGGDNGDQAEEGRYEDEGPCQRITFNRPFAVGRFAVTVAEFQTFTASKKRRHGIVDSQRRASQDDTHPVTNISWTDAVAYCEWLNIKLGVPPNTYRLPSEAEREYFTRAGTDGPFWWEGPISAEKANFDPSRAYGGSRVREVRPHAVALVQAYDPNPWGVYQVHGNVREWCQDAYVPTLDGIPGDGSARGRPEIGRSSGVLRGGSWYNYPVYLRSADRYRGLPDDREVYFGFRVARTL